MSKRRRWIGAAKLAVSLGLLGWLGARVLEREGIDVLAARLDTLDARWAAAAVSLHALAVIAGVLRWRSLLRVSGVELAFPFLARSFLIGRFVGAFTPSTTGLDGWRMWEAGRASGSMSKSAAAIVLEKLVGLVGMAVVCAALLPTGGSALLGPHAIALAVGLALAALLGIGALRRPALLARLASRLPARVRGRANKAVDALSGARLDARSSAVAVGLGVLSHVALSAVFWAAARALGLTVDAWTLLAIGNAIVIAVLLPVSIGGVGVREGVAVLFFATAGVGPTDAVLVALIGYLSGQAPALVGGVLLGLGRATREGAESSSAELGPALAEQTLS